MTNTTARVQKPKNEDELETTFLAHNPRLDRKIINGMLSDPEKLLNDFEKEGIDKNLVLRRAADCGISDSILRQMKRVACDLAGEKTVKHSIGSSIKARECLSCERIFLSTGPGNRLCNRCRGADAGLASI
ncbi:MAG: hypothetical protein VYA34_05610 [Myxococcota bacterium]|nr:hypothetical protein [Myxococcota bacterium]